MPATLYSYAKDVDSPCLRMQIINSNIATALDYLQDDVGGNINIWFVDALSAGDQTILDTIVNTDHDLFVAQAQKKQAIQDYRDYKLYIETYSHTDGYTYPLDSTSQFKIAATLAKINAGVSLPGTFTWRDSSGTDRDFNTDQSFKDFAEAIWSRANDIHDVWKSHTIAVEALATVAAVEAYNYFTNPAWPT